MFKLMGKKIITILRSYISLCLQRSNVVHHIRVKHKGRAFAITETAGLDQLNLSGMDDTDQEEALENIGLDESDDAQSYQGNHVIILWVKVFRSIPEFRILRLTFHRKSASKC